MAALPDSRTLCAVWRDARASVLAAPRARTLRLTKTVTAATRRSPSATKSAAPCQKTREAAAPPPLLHPRGDAYCSAVAC
eukprot:5965384-Prymnesium_polylepis.1